VIKDLEEFYANQPIPLVRQRLREAKEFLNCLNLMVDSGAFEEQHITQLRTLTENRIMILERLIRVSEETIKALKQIE
jgi:hypothetical protein